MNRNIANAQPFVDHQSTDDDERRPKQTARKSVGLPFSTSSDSSDVTEYLYCPHCFKMVDQLLTHHGLYASETSSEEEGSDNGYYSTPCPHCFKMSDRLLTYHGLYESDTSSEEEGSDDMSNHTSQETDDNSTDSDVVYVGTTNPLPSLQEVGAPPPASYESAENYSGGRKRQTARKSCLVPKRCRQNECG